MSTIVRNIGGQLGRLQHLGDSSAEYTDGELVDSSGDYSTEDGGDSSSWTDYLPSADTLNSLLKIGSGLIGGGGGVQSPPQPPPPQHSGSGSTYRPPTGSPVGAKPAATPMAPWILPTAIGGGVLVIGLIAVLALRK